MRVAGNRGGAGERGADGNIVLGQRGTAHGVHPARPGSSAGRPADLPARIWRGLVVLDHPLTPLRAGSEFRTLAQGAWEDIGKQSPLAKEAYDAHVAFLKTMGLL